MPYRHPAMRYVISFLLMTFLLFTGCTAELQPRGATTVPPALSDAGFTMPDGYRLAARHVAPEGPARAVVIALHGFNDYSLSWMVPAGRWATEGIAVYAYDQRGFGANSRPGIWPGVEALQQDLLSVAALVRARHPGLPLYLVGESMGAALTMSVLGSDAPPDVDGAVLAAPAVWARPTMSGPLRGLLSGARNLLPGLVLRGSGTGRVASDNMEMLYGLGRDPLVIKGARVDAVAGLVNLMDAAYHAAPGIRVPVLVLYGQRDQIVPKAAVQRTVARFTSVPDVAVYPKGWHLLFRDYNGPVVQNDVAHWMLKGGAERPSHAHLNAPWLLSDD